MVSQLVRRKLRGRRALSLHWRQQCSVCRWCEPWSGAPRAAWWRVRRGEKEVYAQLRVLLRRQPPRGASRSAGCHARFRQLQRWRYWCRAAILHLEVGLIKGPPPSQRTNKPGVVDITGLSAPSAQIQHQWEVYLHSRRASAQHGLRPSGVFSIRFDLAELQLAGLIILWRSSHLRGRYGEGEEWPKKGWTVVCSQLRWIAM
jgi:hypothetical protein